MASSASLDIQLPEAAGYAVDVDTSGRFPALKVARPDGRSVTLNGKWTPIEDADRWLTTVLRGWDSPLIILIGLGLGYVLDALERRGSTATVIAFEPFPESLPYFLARRDWSSWLSSGRLRIASGPLYPEAPSRIAGLALPGEVPVLVNPALTQAFSGLVVSARMAWLRARVGTSVDLYLSEVKQSMLHPATLTLLEHFASIANGAILEIGAYIGGATMSMARGVRDSGRETPIITIEPGGSYSNQPFLPSDDIFGDLQRNLTSRGLDRFVTLHRGFSRDENAMAAVTSVLASRNAKIGLLAIDADGAVERDLNLFLPLCADGCLISIDDYAESVWHDKWAPTQAAVAKLVDAGRAHKMGVSGYGTWMGVYHATPAS
jgi:predicted O-methyltransferase YrrM